MMKSRLICIFHKILYNAYNPAFEERKVPEDNQKFLVHELH